MIEQRSTLRSLATATLAVLAGLSAADTALLTTGAMVKRRLTQVWEFTAYTKALYDSDLQHSASEGGHASDGLILGIGAHFQTSRHRPAVQLDYEVAQPYYSRATDLNRTMQFFQASFTGRPLRKTSVSWTASASLNNYLEERSVVEDYKFGPGVTYRIDRSNAVSFGATYRERYYYDARHNSVSMTVFGEYERKLSPRSSLEIGYRRDVSNASISKFDFSRNGYYLTFTTEATKNDTVELSLRLRERLDNRQVKGPQRIQDLASTHAWRFGAVWTRDLGHNLKVQAQYLYENRACNDIRRDFANHQLIVELSYKI